MERRSRKAATLLAASILLAATTACNLPQPGGTTTPAPQVATSVVTASGLASTQAPEEESVIPTGTMETAENGINPEGGSSDPSGLIDSDVITSVSIRDGNESYEGQVTFPGRDSSDEISIKPVGFDSTITSGSLIFSLSCTGRGKAKVNYKGGAIRSGSPGCGETWTIVVVNGSPESHITIHLDEGGEVNWQLSVTAGNR